MVLIQSEKEQIPRFLEPILRTFSGESQATEIPLEALQFYNSFTFYSSSRISVAQKEYIYKFDYREFLGVII
jgi:hypothetical protein